MSLAWSGIGGRVGFAQQRQGVLGLSENDLDAVEVVRHGLTACTTRLLRQREGVRFGEDLGRQVALLHEVLLQLADIDLAQSLARAGGRRGGDPGGVALVLDVRLHANHGHHVAVGADGQARHEDALDSVRQQTAVGDAHGKVLRSGGRSMNSG